MSPYLLIEIIAMIFAFIVGFICFLRPNSAIKIQQKFYAKINWKIEPINTAKEIRNTKIMGIINILLGIGIIIVMLTSL